MLITKEVEIAWNAGNKKWYESKGYAYTKMKDKFIVKVEDLNPTGNTYIEVLCDYCNKEVVFKKHIHYIDGRKNIQKDCCSNVKCMKKKRAEVMMLKHGVDNPNKNQEVMEKRFKTNIEKYGGKAPSQNKEVHQKMTDTIMKIYGVENASQSKLIKKKKEEKAMEKFGVTSVFKSKEVREKIKETCNQRYGGNTPMSDEKIKNKAKATRLKRYGVEYLMQNKEYARKVTIKRNKNMYKNGTAPCSTQQKYLHSLLGGELNYPVGRSMLDIGFVEELIFIEYNGSGHTLSVEFGDMTLEQFNIKEMNRNYYLSNKGWKRIQIISTKDYLPSDEIIISLIKKAKEYLNTGHSWFEINIDEEKLKCSQYKIDYDFGELRKIKKQTLDNQKVI